MTSERSGVLRLILIVVFPACGGLLGAVEQSQLNVAGGKLDVTFSESPTELLRKEMLDWISRSAEAVAVYFGGFPVPRAEIRARLSDGRGARNGVTYGWKGALVTITVGRASTAADFADDWLLPHEMLHLGFPSVPDRNHWIEEGISTYVEPLARARAGLITAEEAWGDLVRGMPQGLPRSGDGGLDVTHTWGRTYWGGAIFCLLADVEIRQRTGNRFGLEHALRAIVRAGGTIEADWKIARAIDVGDRATGVPVLAELYAKMSHAPVPVDLEAMWKKLGIERRGREIFFHEEAPLAAIRAAMTRR